MLAWPVLDLLYIPTAIDKEELLGFEQTLHYPYIISKVHTYETESASYSFNFYDSHVVISINYGYRVEFWNVLERLE